MSKPSFYRSRALTVVAWRAVALVILVPAVASARPPIRSDFFSTYPIAVGSRLDDSPSNSHHCGVCHYDFNGGGPRNPFGLGIEIGRANGLTNVQAILAIQSNDSDSDGFTNLVEITEVVLYSNTPTFPGLSSGNAASALNIPIAEISSYLSPTGATDTTPPLVTVSYPNGGESLNPNSFITVTYMATDASGIASINAQMSDDGGATWKPVAKNHAPGGTFQWFVPNLPGPTLLRVEAFDNAGNPGFDVSNAGFTINPVSGGRVPLTLRDVELPGTQPFRGAVLSEPQDCATCHGNYAPPTEPWANCAAA